MRALTCDVLVVGAGPAGASAARAACGAGASVIVAERRAEVGLPVRCAEYIPAMLVGWADVGKDYIAQATVGMRSYLGGSLIQDLTAPGYVIHRDKFDQALVCAAKDTGAQVLTGWQAVAFKEGERSGVCREHDPEYVASAHDSARQVESVMLVGKEGEYLRVEARVVIGADGPHSRVARRVGLANTHALPSLQVRLPLLKEMSHTHIYFDEDITAGYAWLFPKGKVANVGLGMLRRPRAPGLRQTLRRVVRQLSLLGLVKEEPLSSTGGWIPAGPPRPCVAGNCMLVGDAAGHTHPITGGGIFQAVMGGQMAGRWAARAVKEDRVAVLREYEREWNELYGDVLAHAYNRRQDWESHEGVLESAIRRFWIGFREYYAAP